MNEYPNSIRNNMVNTTPYRDKININITSLPDPRKSYKVQKEPSNNIKNIIIAAVIAAATLGPVIAYSNAQTQIREENMSVVSTEYLPGGAILNVTKDPNYSYIETPEGHMVGNYNGIDAQALAKSYAQSGEKQR